MDPKGKRLCTVPAGLVLMASLLAACASGPEGVFEPACMAHAGDRIEFGGELGKGRFEWDRFTDVVSVDGAGNRIDPFPGYPKTGNFEIDGVKVSWTTDDGAALAERYLLDYRGRTWLLSNEQNEAVLDGEAMPECALVLKDDESP
jgi:hypothetical protein